MSNERFLMFKKLLPLMTGALLVATLTACPSPNASEGDNSGDTNNSGTVTKAQFIAQMDCLIAKGGGTASAAGASKIQAEAISDSDWVKTYTLIGVGTGLQNMSKQATDNGCPVS